MITKKLLSLTSLFILICLFASCEYKWIEGVDPSVPVSFAGDVQPIFNAKCVSCHVSGGQASFSFVAGSSYESITVKELADINSPAASKLLTETHANGAYSESDKQTILIWIQQGAKDN